MINWLVLMGVGKVLIYLWMIFPLPPMGKIIDKLHMCDLCSGVHIYALLSFILGIYLFPFYVPIVSEYITGGVVSFIVHIFSIGWEEKFSTTVIV